MNGFLLYAPSGAEFGTRNETYTYETSSLNSGEHCTIRRYRRPIYQLAAEADSQAFQNELESELGTNRSGQSAVVEVLQLSLYGIYFMAHLSAFSADGMFIGRKLPLIQNNRRS